MWIHPGGWSKCGYLKVFGRIIENKLYLFLGSKILKINYIVEQLNAILAAVLSLTSRIFTREIRSTKYCCTWRDVVDRLGWGCVFRKESLFLVPCEIFDKIADSLRSTIGQLFHQQNEFTLPAVLSGKWESQREARKEWEKMEEAERCVSLPFSKRGRTLDLAFDRCTAWTDGQRRLKTLAKSS